MIVELGHFALALAVAVALVQMLAPLAAGNIAGAGARRSASS